MFHLLPDDYKKSILAEYKRRRIVVVVSGVALLGVIANVHITPSLALIWGDRQEVSQEYSRGAGLSPEEEARVQYQIKFLKESAALPDVASRPLEFFERVITSKNQDIRIRGFSFTTENKKITLSVSGVALNRDALVAFSRSLKEKGRFSSVDLPVENLARGRNAEFRITLTP